MAVPKVDYTIHDWRWVASVLSDPNWPAPQLPIVDTIIVDRGKPGFWLALNEDAALTSKPVGSSSTSTELFNTFSSFSFGYQRNREGGQKACVAHYAVGNPQAMDKAAFATHLTVGFLVATCVQPYAVPQGCVKLPTNLRFEYFAVSDPALRDPSLPAVPVFRYVETQDPQPGEASYRLLPAIVVGSDGPIPGAPRIGAPVPAELISRMERVTVQLVNYLQRAVPSERVAKLVAEFSVDDDGQLWLVYVPEVRSEYNPFLILPLRDEAGVGAGAGTALNAIGAAAMHNKAAPTVTLPDGRVITQHRVGHPEIPVVGIKELTELRSAASPHPSLQAIGGTLVHVVTGVARDWKRAVAMLRGSGSDEMLMSMRALESTPWLVSLDRLSALQPILTSDLFLPGSLRHVGQLAERVGQWCLGICNAALEYYGCPSYGDLPVLLAAISESESARAARVRLIEAGAPKKAGGKGAAQAKVDGVGAGAGSKPFAVPRQLSHGAAAMLDPDHPLARSLVPTRASRAGARAHKPGSGQGYGLGTAGSTELPASAPFPTSMSINTADGYVHTGGGGATLRTAGLGIGTRQAFSAGVPSGVYGISESGSFVCADGVSTVNWIVMGQRDPSRPSLHSLILINDLFDSWERSAALIAPLVPHGAHVLVVNLPGQPYTQYVAAVPSPSTPSLPSPAHSEPEFKDALIGSLAATAGAFAPGAASPPSSSSPTTEKGRADSGSGGATLGANGLFQSSGVRPGGGSSPQPPRSGSPVRLPAKAFDPLRLPNLPLTHIIATDANKALQGSGVIGMADPVVRAERSQAIAADGSYRVPGAKRGPANPIAEPSVLNNEFHAACLEQLLVYLEGMRLFRTSTASWGYDLVGYGLGGPSALAWAARFGRVHNRRGKKEEYTPKDKSGKEVLKGLQGLRSVTLLNAPAWLDPQLRTILESSRSVLSAFPSDKPDLPLSYFSRFLFSDRYLAAVSRETAVSQYTSSPGSTLVSLPARIALVHGALCSTDMRPFLPGLGVPLIVVQGVADALVAARSAGDIARARIKGMPATGSTGYPILVEISGDPFIPPISLTKPDMSLNTGGWQANEEPGSRFRRLSITAPQPLPLPTPPPGNVFFDTLLAPEAILRLVATLGAPGTHPPDTLVLTLQAGHELRQERPTAVLDLLRTLIDTDGVLSTVQMARPETREEAGGEGQGEDSGGGHDTGGGGGEDENGASNELDPGQGKGSGFSGVDGTAGAGPRHGPSNNGREGGWGEGRGEGGTSRGVSARGMAGGRVGLTPGILQAALAALAALPPMPAPILSAAGPGKYASRRRPSVDLTQPLRDPKRNTAHAVVAGGAEGRGEASAGSALQGEGEEDEDDGTSLTAIDEVYWASLPTGPASVHTGFMLQYNPAPVDEEAQEREARAAAKAADAMEKEKAAHNASTLDKLMAAQEARREGWNAEDKTVIKLLLDAAAARRSVRDAAAKELVAFGRQEALVASVKTARAMAEAATGGKVVLPTLPLGPLRKDAMEFADEMLKGQDEPGGLSTFESTKGLSQEEYDAVVDIPFAILREQAAAASEHSNAREAELAAQLELLRLGCSIKLQAWWRGRLACILVRRKRALNFVYSTQQKSAIKMQRAFRKNRRVFREMRYRREQKMAWRMHHSCTQMQSVVRGYFAREAVKAMRIDRSARHVQRVYRGYRDRLLTKLVRAAKAGVKRFTDAATYIQSMVRMIRVRRDYAELKIVVLASVQVQRWFRGHHARVEFKRMKKLHYMPTGSEKVIVGMEHLQSLTAVLHRSKNRVESLRRALFRVEDEMASTKIVRGKLVSKMAILDKRIAEMSSSEGEMKGILVAQAQGGVDRALQSAGGPRAQRSDTKSPSPDRKQGQPLLLKETGNKLLDATARSLNRISSRPARGVRGASTSPARRASGKEGDVTGKGRKGPKGVQGKAGSASEQAEPSMPSGAHLMLYDGSNLRSSRFSETKHGEKYTGPRLDGEAIRKAALGMESSLPGGLASIIRGQDVTLGRGPAKVQSEYKAVRAEVDYQAELALRATYAARGKVSVQLVSERARCEVELAHVKSKLDGLSGQAQSINAALKRNDQGFYQLKANMERLSDEQRRQALLAEPKPSPPIPTAAQVQALQDRCDIVQIVSHGFSDALTIAATATERFAKSSIPLFAAGNVTLTVARQMNYEALSLSVNRDEEVMVALLGPVRPGGSLGGFTNTNIRPDLHTAVRKTLQAQADEEGVVISRGHAVEASASVRDVPSMSSSSLGIRQTTFKGAHMVGMGDGLDTGSVFTSAGFHMTDSIGSLGDASSLPTRPGSGTRYKVARPLPADDVAQLMARTGFLQQDLEGTKGPNALSMTVLPRKLATDGHVVVGGTLVPLQTSSQRAHLNPKRLGPLDPDTQPLGAAIPLAPKDALLIVDNKVRSVGMLANQSMLSMLRIAAGTDTDTFNLTDPDESKESEEDGDDVVLAPSRGVGSGARAALARRSSTGSASKEAEKVDVGGKEKAKGKGGALKRGPRDTGTARQPTPSLQPVLYAFETVVTDGNEKGAEEAAAEATALDAEEARKVLVGMPRKLREWTMDDVIVWLRALGLGAYVPAFKKPKVDGEFLPRITARDLRDTFGMTERRHLATLLSGREELMSGDKRNDCNLGITPGALSRAMEPTAGLTGQAAAELATLEDVKPPSISALIALAAAGRVRKLEYYMRAGQDPNTADENGNTMLIMGAAHGHRRLVDMLVARGARVSTANGVGNTALHYLVDPTRKAVVDPDGSVARYLIARGASLDARNARGAIPSQGIRAEDAAVDPVIGGLLAAEALAAKRAKEAAEPTLASTLANMQQRYALPSIT